VTYWHGVLRITYLKINRAYNLESVRLTRKHAALENLRGVVLWVNAIPIMKVVWTPPPRAVNYRRPFSPKIGPFYSKDGDITGTEQRFYRGVTAAF